MWQAKREGLPSSQPSGSCSSSRAPAPFRLQFAFSLQQPLAAPTLRVSGPLVSAQLLLRVTPVGPPVPRTCSVPRTRAGSAPGLNPSHMSPSSTAGILTKTTSKKKQNTQKMEREGFCKVLLGSYFCIILPISSLCSGNLKTNALCFYGFLWRCPSGRAVPGGHPGRSSGGISQVQTGVSPPTWRFRHDGLFSGCCAFSRGVHYFVHTCR